jgi:hypothetical protein
MAVSIKSLNGLGAIAKLGIDQKLLGWLSEGHYEIKLTSKEFAFFPAGSADLPPVATVPVTLDLLQKPNGGTLPEKDKIGLAMTMTSTLEKLQSIADSGTMQKLKAQVEAQKQPIKATIGAAQPAFTPAPLPSGWPVFDQKTMFSAPLTKLRDATLMYQPVSGTSGGSRYFMVAANQDLQIGARWHGGTLSVRIEGSGWKKHVSGIKAVGFEKIEGDYASLHLNVGADALLANKTFGAILLGLGIPIETPLPNLAKIKQ